MTLFKTARAELLSLGLVIEQAPGQYRVNFPDADETTAYVTDDLDDALNHGRAMASEPPPARLPPLGPTGPKASRRGVMYRHNRKLAAKRRKA